MLHVTGLAKGPNRRKILAVVGAILTSLQIAHITHGATAVNGTDDIFAAGQLNIPSFNNGGGVFPLKLDASSGAQFQFAATGTVSFHDLDSGYRTANPDGGTSAVPVENVFSPNQNFSIPLSGFHGQNAALVGLFLADSLPATPPATLDFTAAGLGSSFASLSPALGQVFFVGDGQTGTGSGATQTFIAPSGATHLFLGLADTGGDPLGSDPGTYGDDNGTYSVTISTVPEPGAFFSLSLGVMTLLSRSPRRRRVFAA